MLLDFFSKLSTDNFCPKRNKYNYSLFDASKNVRWLQFSVERVCLFVPLSTSVLFNVINFILIFNCENEQWIKVCAVNVWGGGGESGPQEVVLHIERMHIVFSVRSIISQSHWELEIEQNKRIWKPGGCLNVCVCVWKCIEPDAMWIDKKVQCTAFSWVEKNWKCRDGNRNGKCKMCQASMHRHTLAHPFNAQSHHCGVQKCSEPHIYLHSKMPAENFKWTEKDGNCHTLRTTNRRTSHPTKTTSKIYILNVSSFWHTFTTLNAKWEFLRWITSRKRCTHVRPTEWSEDRGNAWQKREWKERRTRVSFQQWISCTHTRRISGWTIVSENGICSGCSNAHTFGH